MSILYPGSGFLSTRDFENGTRGSALLMGSFFAEEFKSTLSVTAYAVTAPPEGEPSRCGGFGFCAVERTNVKASDKASLTEGGAPRSESRILMIAGGNHTTVCVGAEQAGGRSKLKSPRRSAP